MRLGLDEGLDPKHLLTAFTDLENEKKEKKNKSQIVKQTASQEGTAQTFLGIVNYYNKIPFSSPRLALYVRATSN